MLNLEQHQLDAAEQSLEKCHALLREVAQNVQGESAEWGRYEQLVGRIALNRDQSAKALLHLQNARVIFEKTNTIIEEGQSTYWCGIALHKTGKTVLAINTLETALSIFERLDDRANIEMVKEKITELSQLTTLKV